MAKVSSLISDILNLADLKFDTNSSHLNDAISIGINYVSMSQWQVWLERPSKKTLNYSGNRIVESFRTIRLQENKVSFFNEGDSLISALKKLHNEIYVATSWTDGNI